MRFISLPLLLTLLPMPAVWAQSGSEGSEPASGRMPRMEPGPRMAPQPRVEQPRVEQPRMDQPRLPSERNERFAPRMRAGQTEPEFRERQPLFERRDPRQERYGNIEDRRGGLQPPDRIDSDLNRAVEQVQSRHGGKILSADRMRHRGQDVYRVKVLTPEGRVKTVQLPDPQASTPPNSEEHR